MKASIIIPTRNRAEVLGHCLESLTRQSLPREQFEVLVIDNGSTDHTPQVAARFSGLLMLTYVLAPEPGLHVGRHEGTRRAKSNILIFADDDIEAGQGWVQAVVDSFSDTGVALVGGNNYPLFEAEPPAWLLRWWQRPVNRGRALGYLSILDFGTGRFHIDPGFVWGCNFAVRRSALLAAGGFHPDALPEDRMRYRGDGETHVSDSVRNSGSRALFNSDASVQHRVSATRMTREYFAQRAYAQGISDSYSDIRRCGRAGLGLTTVKRRMARLRSSLLQRLQRLSPGDEVDRQLHDILRAARRAYRCGYDFHQRQVRDDPALLEWVLRKDYL